MIFNKIECGKNIMIYDIYFILSEIEKMNAMNSSSFWQLLPKI